MKSYKKNLTRCVEVGTFIVNFEGEILNSKNEWHQPRIIRTTVVQGGAEMAGNRVPSYQRDGRQPEPQSSLDVGATPGPGQTGQARPGLREQLYSIFLCVIFI